MMEEKRFKPIGVECTTTTTKTSASTVTSQNKDWRAECKMEEKRCKPVKVEETTTTSSSSTVKSQYEDWRAEFTTDVRQKIVSKIVERLKERVVDVQMCTRSNPECLNHLITIAVQFEDKTFKNSHSKENYIDTIREKIGTRHQFKSMDAQTTGLGPASISNDASHGSGTDMSQCSQDLAGNVFERKPQAYRSPHSQREVQGSQPSEKLGYSLQQQEFQDEAQNTKKSSVFSHPDIHIQRQQQQQHVTSQTAEYIYPQSSSWPNQQFRQQNDASMQLWSMSQQNVSQSIQQPLGQQRDVSELQFQKKLLGSQPIILNPQLHQSPIHMLQQGEIRSSEQTVQEITQPVLLHQILGSHKQSGSSQEVHPSGVQTSLSLHQQRNRTDQQQVFQSSRLFSGSSSASIECKESSQPANTVDWHDEAYLKLQDMKQRYGPVIESLCKQTVLLCHKAASPEEVTKYKKQLFNLERAVNFLSLQRSQMLHICKKKFEQIQQYIMMLVTHFYQKNSAIVDRQAQHCVPASGRSQTSQPHTACNVKLQNPPVNLPLSTSQGSALPVSSIQSQVPNSQSNQFNSPQYSIGLGLEQRNGPLTFQNPVKKTDQNNVGVLAHTNFSSNKIVKPFDSTSTHHNRLQQNLRRRMQSQTIQLDGEWVQMQNNQKGVTPATAPTTKFETHSSSPRKPQHSSSHIDQQTFPLASPSSPLTPSSTHLALTKGDIQTQIHNQSPESSTPGISASPLLAEFTEPGSTQQSSDISQQLRRLLDVVKSLSPKALSAAVHEMDSVVNMVNMIAGAAADEDSRAAIGEDLAAETRCHLQESNFGLHHLGIYGREEEHQIKEIASDSVSQSKHQLSDSDSTATSLFKRRRTEPINNLLNEIRKVNRQFVETLVDLDSAEDDSTSSTASEGAIVRFSYTPVAFDGNYTPFSSALMYPVISLRLLIPPTYPNSSPVILERNSVDLSEESEILSEKARLRFGLCIRNLSEPMSLVDMAKSWDDSARAVLFEHVQPIGGECFSSRYGTWESCITA